jgi:hypothetical protein
MVHVYSDGELIADALKEANLAEEKSGDEIEDRLASVRPSILQNLSTAGSTQQRKALMRNLIKEIRVLSRDEIVPTYRVPALVRAPRNQVDLSGFEPLTSPVRGARSTN